MRPNRTDGIQEVYATVPVSTVNNARRSYRFYIGTDGKIRYIEILEYRFITLIFQSKVNVNGQKSGSVISGVHSSHLPHLTFFSSEAAFLIFDISVDY